ncbi:TPA: DNA polymerase III subunit theta [Proteus mirabilis]|nr:DNA polymerase III subunit theta [Proteus mirabilis]
MNLANLTQEEKDKINVDLAASGVAYKERLNMPFVASEVERKQPAHLREYFNERLAFYRERSEKLPDGKSVRYLKEEKYINCDKL